jgi:hypothetical protein
MLLLAEGVRPPVAGLLATSEGAEPPAVLGTAMRQMLMDRDRGIWVTYTLVDGSTPQEELNKIPVVFLAGSGSMGGLGPGVPERLKRYVEDEGFIAVVSGTDMAGRKFMNEAKARLKQVLGASETQKLSETDEIFSTLAKKPSLDVMPVPPRPSEQGPAAR